MATAAEAAQIGRRLPARPAADDGGADAPRTSTSALSAGSEVAVWREGFRRPARRPRPGAGSPGPRPRQARQRHGPARQPRPRRGAGAGPRLRRRPRPRAGRRLDPLRHRRRTRLRLLRRAARPLRRASPTRSRPSSPPSSPTPPTAPPSSATRRSHFDMARCGVAVYGLDPFQGDPAERGLAPALSLRSYVADVKRFAAGDSAPATGGPGGRSADTWVGVLPLGYGDGVRRGLSNNAEVLVRGRRHPLVGTVSMDNVTHRPRPRDRGRAGRRGGADRRPGRGGDPRRGGGGPPRHDQLRGHLRDLGPGAAATRREPRRSPRCRAAWSQRRGEALGGGEDAWIVGGAVRDAALGREVADLDLAVAGDPAAAAKAIAREGGGHAFELSAEFGDLAGRRPPTAPGRSTSPRCAATTIEADLAARDFTIGAVAVPLAGGEPLDPYGGLADLDRRLPARGRRAQLRRGPAAAAARRAAGGRARASRSTPGRSTSPAPRPAAPPSRPASASSPSCASCSAAPTRCAASRCSTSSA